MSKSMDGLRLTRSRILRSTLPNNPSLESINQQNSVKQQKSTVQTNRRKQLNAKGEITDKHLMISGDSDPPQDLKYHEPLAAAMAAYPELHKYHGPFDLALGQSMVRVVGLQPWQFKSVNLSLDILAFYPLSFELKVWSNNAGAGQRQSYGLYSPYGAQAMVSHLAPFSSCS